MSIRSVTNRLRKPEYTGENRCNPCTVANITIAVVLAGAIGTVVSVPAGVVVFGASVAAIYLRGYLVPGTPTITRLSVFQRIEHLLQFAFHLLVHRPAHLFYDHDHGDDPHEPDIDPRPVFRELGIIEPCDDMDDVCLEDGVRADWHREIRQYGREREHERLRDLLGIEDVHVEYEDPETGNCIVYGNGTPEVVWESRAVMAADLTAMSLLKERHPEWDRLNRDTRGSYLTGLRAFIDRCPLCEEDLEWRDWCPGCDWIHDEEDPDPEELQEHLDVDLEQTLYCPECGAQLIAQEAGA